MVLLVFPGQLLISFRVATLCRHTGEGDAGTESWSAMGNKIKLWRVRGLPSC